MAVLKMREAAGLTQVQSAKTIGSAHSVVARLERRELRREPRAKVLHRIAQACGVGFEMRLISRPTGNMPVVLYKAASRAGVLGDQLHSPALPADESN